MHRFVVSTRGFRLGDSLQDLEWMGTVDLIRGFECTRILTAATNTCVRIVACRTKCTSTSNTIDVLTSAAGMSCKEP